MRQTIWPPDVCEACPLNQFRARAPVHSPAGIVTSVRKRAGLAWQLIPIDDVLYCEASHKYVDVHHLQGQTAISRSVTQLVAAFPAQLITLRRGLAVSRARVRKLAPVDHSYCWSLGLCGVPHSLSVARRHVRAVQQLLRSAARPA